MKATADYISTMSKTMEFVSIGIENRLLEKEKMQFTSTFSFFPLSFFFFQKIPIVLLKNTNRPDLYVLFKARKSLLESNNALLFCMKERVSVNSFLNDKFLDSSKLKEFAADTFKFDENGRKFLKRVENTVGKGEIAPSE